MPTDELHWKTFYSITDIDSSILRHSDIETGDLFSTLQWLELLEQSSFPEQYSSYICAAATDGGIKALLPLQAGHRNGLAAGRGLHSMSNYYSPLFSPYSVAGTDGVAAMDFIFQQLSRAHPAWHWLNLEPLSQQERDRLDLSLTQNGFNVFPYFRFGNWYLRLQGRSFADYSRDLPGRLLNTITRKRKKLDKQGYWDIRIYTGVEELQQGLDAYWQVYNSSWKQTEPYPDFINGLIKLAAEQGWLRLGVLSLAQQPVAAQLWLVYRGTASIYKLAYDERFKELSPGSVLSQHMFEQVIDADKVEEIDYLVGDDAYKRDWMSERRERWGIMAFNQTTLQGRGLVAVERVKRMLKSVRGK